MEILKFEGGAPRGRAKSSSNKKTIRVAVALGAVALVGVLSSTLAANISINTGGNVEFGQGLAGAAACDSTLTITPTSSFTNGTTSTGTFYFSGLTIADLVNTTDGTHGLSLCKGDYIRVAAYDSGTASAVNISTSGGSTAAAWEFYINSTNTSGIAQVTLPTPTASVGTITTTSKSFTLSLNSANVYATAGAIYKLTVESHS